MKPHVGYDSKHYIHHMRQVILHVTMAYDYIIMTYDYCGVILYICTIHYNTSCNVGALKTAQCTAVASL